MRGTIRKRDKAKIAVALLDALAITTCYFAAYYLRFWSGLFETFLYVPVRYYLYAWPVVLLVFTGSFAFLGIYETRKPFSALDIFMDCLKGILLATVLVLPLSFWYRGFSYSRWVVIINAALLVVLMPLLRGLFQKALEDRRRRGRDRLPLLVIGTGEQAEKLDLTLKDHPELGYHVTGFLRGNGLVEDRIDDGRILGDLSRLVPVIHEHQIEEVAIAEESLDPQKEFLLLQPCRAEDLKIRVVPALYDFALSVRGLRVIDNLFWYTLEPPASQRWYGFLKRGMDIAGALVFLIPGAILLPFVALAIRLDSPGPIVFRQKRTGTNGKAFTMYKFRSMVSNAEEALSGLIDKQTLASPAFKLENDPRVTRVGRILRRFSLDEWPQFFNVLKGDMSLVGPRPEEIWIADRYDERQRARLQVKPGITGFQQIHCRGSEDFNDRLRHDLYYINNQSLFLDVSILLETLWVVLLGKGRH